MLLSREKCEDVYEPRCERGYQIKYKTECSYEQVARYLHTLKDWTATTYKMFVIIGLGLKLVKILKRTIYLFSVSLVICKANFDLILDDNLCQFDSLSLND